MENDFGVIERFRTSSEYLITKLVLMKRLKIDDDEFDYVKFDEYWW